MKRNQLRITEFLLIICMILGTIFPVCAESENAAPEIMKRTVIPEEVQRASQKS